MEQVKLKGVFGDKNIFIENYINYGNPNIILNIHGAFGETNEKYRKFANRIFESDKATVILATSSRLSKTYLLNYEDEFEEKKSLFKGKTIKEEVEDFEIVINYILENSEKIFGISRKDLNITINGNSLGGIIALYLAEKFKEIKNISLVGTGSKLNIKGTTLLDTWPDIIELKRICSIFNGKVLLNFGTEDDIFTQETFVEIYSLISTDKSFVKFIGVDHSFKKINSINSEIPYLYIYKNILELIDGKLVSGEINLLEYKNNETIDKIILSDKNIDKYFRNDNDGFI